MKLKIFSVLLLLSSCVIAQTGTKTKTSTQKKKVTEKKETARIDEFEMKQYFLVLLKTGPKRDQDSAAAAKIQEGHLNHLDKMYKEGKLDLAGPLGDKSDIRGICVYNLAALEEVKRYVEMDPAIQSGRLVAEIHPWWAAKNSTLR